MERAEEGIYTALLGIFAMSYDPYGHDRVEHTSAKVAAMDTLRKEAKEHHHNRRGAPLREQPWPEQTCTSAKAVNGQVKNQTSKLGMKQAQHGEMNRVKKGTPLLIQAQ